MEPTGTHDYPIVRTIGEAYPPQFTETDSSNGVTYTGWAKRGSADVTKAIWKIQKKTVTVVGTVTTTKIEWPDGQENFDQVWNNRATLAYAL